MIAIATIQLITSINNEMMMKRFSSLLVIAAPLLLTPIATAQSLPLKAGTYNWASYFIQLENKGDRWCFMGSNVRTTYIASLTPDAKRPGFYSVYGRQDALIRQEKPDVISYGGMAYSLNRQVSNSVIPEMKQCLNAQAPYSKQVEMRR